MRARFRGLIPGANWVPSDLPSQDQGATKKKPHRSLFSLKASSDPQHGELKQRKSTISLKSEPDPEVDARTRPQAQSRFFALLPLEIRRMVYEYVIGEENIHLTFSQKKKFGHFICDGQHVEGRECACRVLVGGRKSDRLDGGGARMLRSCRRMYSEAVPYLYRPHTFSLLHITHLLYLPSSLPQPRLNTIRRLQLRWAMRALPYLRRGSKLAYKEDTSNWEKAWRIMAAMEGLRELCVVLIDPSPQSMWERNWLELEPRLLEPVKAVSRPQCFDLVLPYASCSTAWEMGDSNVMLRRPEGAEGSDDEDQI